MGRNIIKISFLIILSVLFFTISCGLNGGEYEEPGQGNEAVINEPVYWEPDNNGWIQFYLNDPAYLNPVNGSTEWMPGDYKEMPMEYVEIEVSKYSGSPSYGYGVIFCVQDDTDPSDSTDDSGFNYLTVMIDVNGNFCIGKVTDTDKNSDPDFEYISIGGKNWTPGSSLSKGYSQVNRIKVQYTGNNTFEITFNNDDSNKITFEYNQSPQFVMQGRYGYIAVIAPDENFPDTPVDVRFRQVYPIDIQLPSL